MKDIIEYTRKSKKRVTFRRYQITIKKDYSNRKINHKMI